MATVQNRSNVLAIRNAPVQSRSRARLQEILGAAEKIIAERGTDQLKMNDVATEANVPIGAVYNFFPNRTALIAHLLKQHLDTMCSIEAVVNMTRGPWKTPAEFAQIMVDSITAIHFFVRRNKVFREIWSGALAYREIREIDLQDSKVNAADFSKQLRRLDKDIDEEALQAKALAIVHLLGSCMRMASMLDRQSADQIVKSYTFMALAHAGFDKKTINSVKFTF